MYEKKNKLSQPAPILIKISARLSHAVYRSKINEHSLLCLAKYRLYMPFETISDAAFTF